MPEEEGLPEEMGMRAKYPIVLGQMEEISAEAKLLIGLCLRNLFLGQRAQAINLSITWQVLDRRHCDQIGWEVRGRRMNKADLGNNKLRGLTDYDWQEAKSLKEVSEMDVVDAGDYYGFEGFEDDYCDDDIQQMNLQADGSEIDDVDGDEK
ncbi:hypothetical protein PPACK8108_LOCUS21455 [Phakopsora pachyrhizi]|uniref:Uncharacterized protein n=1 Tax=Phakopsora pachyrhizi TaxID=170000 RepID=A0AAV0BHH5_PHAPC|nr:hypothetical protein PPACK8108_LOCUS21455 [Phakopsora pachyrhizi]